MDRFTRITVPLSRIEWERLRITAVREYRHPREQARYLIHRALLGESMSANDNTGAKTAKPDAGVVEVAR